MIKLENTEVFGWRGAIRGARNPKNSWDKADSLYFADGTVDIGPNDMKMLMGLCKAGSDHRKFMRMITVQVDIVAPLYFYKELDTYKVSTVCNSCSTMHKIHERPLTLEDFSHDHLNMESVLYLENTIRHINDCREKFLETNDKDYWWQMIQLLPSSYNQRRTMQFNYETLANIYRPDARRHHKLDEWNVAFDGSFCQWIEKLPYSELIICCSKKDKNNE